MSEDTSHRATPGADISEEDTESAAPVRGEGERKLSRMERIKQKVRKLQGKDPDIYPMW